MLKELEPIKEYLFLDSGTLLGIYRDNKILENDTDIDLFCFLQDSKNVWNYINSNLKEYKISRQFYKNNLVKIICTPKNDNLRVDIHIFETKDKYNYSKAYRWINPKGVLNKIIKKIYFKVRPFFKSERLDILEKLNLIEIKQWTYPWHFHNEFRYLNDWKTPFKIEEYLEFRYTKNWKYPANNWDYWIDDGALK